MIGEGAEAKSLTLSIVIPTFERGLDVLRSLEFLLGAPDPADEILVVDQTPSHAPDVELRLTSLAACGVIRWIRLAEPSIPHAMNVGLSAAVGDCVLFLDDDITPDVGLLATHRRAQGDSLLVAGMVLQPGERPESISSGTKFRFNSDRPATVDEFMGGNFSIRREAALKLGGFDENFVGAAFRFEAEFAHRFLACFGPIRYDPAAVINHLASPRGGTRAHGDHLRTSRPTHSVGAGYRNFKHPLRAVCAVARGGASVGLAWLGAPSQSVWAG